MVFNEKEYGKFLYEHQADTILPPKTYTVWELTILAKYLRQELKKSEKEIKNGIIKFCNLNYPGFDADVEYEKINKVMSECYKTDLRTCIPVPITKTEWNNIQKCSTDKIQKLLFAILAVAKFNRLNPVAYIDEENEEERVYEDTRLRCNETETNLYKLMKMTFEDPNDKFAPYGELGRNNLNFIEAVNSNKVKRILNFGELEPKEEDVLIYIEDFECLPDYFLGLKERDRIKHCEDCGRVFIDKSKYKLQRKCHDCKKSEKTITQERKFCVECGGEIFIKHNAQESQIRCRDCQRKFENKKKVEKYQKIAMKTKEIICEDCGKLVEINAKNNSTTRCSDCYTIYRAQKLKENRKARQQEKKNGN